MTNLPYCPPTVKNKGQDKAKELRRRIDDSLGALARAVDDVRASDTIKACLNVQAKFHRYSWHNTMLITTQRPEATQVAGYGTWQKLGRQVCKSLSQNPSLRVGAPSGEPGNVVFRRVSVICSISTFSSQLVLG